MNKKIIYSALCLALCGSMTSCLKDGTESIMLETVGNATPSQTEVNVVKSDEGVEFTAGGVKISVPHGAVGTRADGAKGELPVTVTRLETLPTTLPGGAIYKEGSAVQIDPMGVNFVTPVMLTMTAANVNVADNVQVYRYNEAQSRWEKVSGVKRDAEGKFTFPTLSLGIFAIGVDPNALTTGGVHITRGRNLTTDTPEYMLAPSYTHYAVAETVPGIHKRIAVAAPDQDLWIDGLAPGEHTIVLARERRLTPLEASAGIEYSQPLTVTVTEPLRKGTALSVEEYTGWAELPYTDIVWSQGRPAAWGEATATPATGKFQATLTWANSDDELSDYDLHLYGPNNMHVSAANPKGYGFELDKESGMDAGDCIEHLFSTSEGFSRGDYRLTVQLYQGMKGRRYHCRVIMDGTVVKHLTGTITTDKGEMEIYRFTVR